MLNEGAVKYVLSTKTHSKDFLINIFRLKNLGGQPTASVMSNFVI